MSVVRMWMFIALLFIALLISKSSGFLSKYDLENNHHCKVNNITVTVNACTVSFSFSPQ